MSDYIITEFGAKNDGDLCTESIQEAIDKAYKNGGGRIVIPPGEFLTGALLLKDNIEIHLAAGAILKFSDRQEDYFVVTSRWEGVAREVYASCLYAENSCNIAITGFGTINGNGERWWHIFRNEREKLLYPRPKLISLDGCENISIKDVSLINSPSWTINPICSNNITIDNLTINNPKDSPNTDGIDPESCSNVRISNCHIDVGDDCIAIKAGTEDTAERVACENITITNCTMVHGHGGVVLGSEMSGDIRNVTISNCIFQDTDRGIRLKSRRGRGGVVEDIRVDNIVMEGVICPFILNLYYFCGPKGKDKYVWDKHPYPVTVDTPMFRRIHFANITARNVHASAGFIYGLAEQYVSELTFNQIDISLAENAIPGKPAMMAGIEDMSNRGFYVGFAKDILFNRVTIENHEGPAFYLEYCDDIELTNCKSKNTKKEEALLKEVKA
ncbi:glycoside hydrolase family 28 protein [Niallia alba]|uniref:Glycoside hydrolase family 28 protein n=1 Tax=Niallia circulans TaxID=1397 RepID=A0A941JM00_NIACI|nr:MULTISPECIES: glycoside hydrolase family 28 protein [Niallia]MCB5236438.1 glycoside hydrolase family 28 protein [Niallia circulans]MED3794029.1 glycoside hydrolase family 28 protein [Niallia alba]